MTMFTIDLTGKSAIITGASQGLGASCARMLHKAGANVVLNYFDDPAGHNRKNAQALADELGPRAVAIAADVRKYEQVAAMMDQCVGTFGGLDILVNNAGILRDKTIKKMTMEEWQAVIDTNLSGVFNCNKAAAERIRDNGRIISLASIAASLGFFGQANYAAAKAGVAAMSRVLSRELGRKGVTVNAVAPGVVLTEMGKSIPEEVRQQMVSNIPLGRFGEPEEITQTILFLASPMASYITGQTIHVNGGWYAGM
jgi:3-oxoacyl-[acyl-carrier protein] reductase